MSKTVPQAGISLKPDTRELLKQVKGDKPWDNFVLELIDCYLDHRTKFDTNAPLKATGTHTISGLNGLESERGDLIRFEVMKGEDIADVMYARVTNIQKPKMKGKQIITTIEYEVVGI